METLTYQAIFERAEDGSIGGYAPEVPGATGAGDTLEEARVSLRRGIELWIELAQSQGKPVPAPSTAIAAEPITIHAA